MKVHGLNSLLMTAAMMLYASPGYGHAAGEHSGGLLQQLMHIVQNADHLFIVLALVVVAAMLLRQFGKSRN